MKDIIKMADDQKDFETAAKKKRRGQLIFGIFMFELYLILSIFNFLMGGFFFYMMMNIHLPRIIWVVTLCWINTLVIILMALESYIVYVKNQKAEWIRINYGDDV